MTCFKKSEYFRSSSQKKYIFVKNKILEIAPWAKVLPIGGTFIKGALTKGDVDLLVRLRKNEFSKTIKLLRTFYKENNKELWNDDFAIFKDDRSFAEKIDILVVSIGSQADVRHKATKLLRNNKLLLKEYNQMKAKFADKGSDEYKAAKGNFYNKLEAILSANCDK